MRASLVYLTLGAASVGIWATAAPRSFFRSFPGGGRHWVAAEGPYNLHLVTDVGALFLVLLAVTLAALGSGRRTTVRTAGVAWVVSATPHFLHHVVHRAVLSAGDQLASLGSLALQVVCGLVCVVAATPTRRGAVSAPRPESTGSGRAGGRPRPVTTALPRRAAGA